MSICMLFVARQIALYMCTPQGLLLSCTEPSQHMPYLAVSSVQYIDPSIHQGFCITGRHAVVCEGLGSADLCLLNSAATLLSSCCTSICKTREPLLIASTL